MRHSFAPLDHDAVMFLTEATHIDYTSTDFANPDWLCVSCRDEDGSVMGLCVFEMYNRFDAHFSIAIKDKRCITRQVMRAMFRAVFSQATRVTALIEPWNAPAIRQAELMGFQYEGFMRNAIEGKRDAILLGMLPEDCRYLKERGRHGQFPKSTGPVSNSVSAAERRH
jgi:RimJ/RimL family protein N-acetyltransferase